MEGMKEEAFDFSAEETDRFYESMESPVLRMRRCLNTQVALKRPKGNRNTARIAQVAEKLPQKHGEISYVHGTEYPRFNDFLLWAAKVILKGLLKNPPGPLREQLVSVVTWRIAKFGCSVTTGITSGGSENSERYGICKHGNGLDHGSY
jgi:hypothetical protein